jgi:hypothetical protein
LLNLPPPTGYAQRLPSDDDVDNEQQENYERQKDRHTSRICEILNPPSKLLKTAGHVDRLMGVAGCTRSSAFECRADEIAIAPDQAALAHCVSAQASRKPVSVAVPD